MTIRMETGMVFVVSSQSQWSSRRVAHEISGI